MIEHVHTTRAQINMKKIGGSESNRGQTTINPELNVLK